MLAKISNRVEDNGCLSFTLVNADYSLANSLRRFILAEIPVCCIRTESEAINHNEIIFYIIFRII